MTYHFRNIVMEGGGVKGIAYLGAMEILEQKGILPQIKRVGGASAGAINALMLGLNYSPSEMHEILWSLDFEKFKDHDFGFGLDFIRLIRDYGWYKGKYFRSWMGDLIARKTGNTESTFAEIKASGKFRDLYFIGTNLSTHMAVIFSHEHTPNMTVADAVRISMSIPLFFAARKLEGNVYVDGSVLDNYPIKLFDFMKYAKNPASCRETEYYGVCNRNLTAGDGNMRIYNKETLGFRLDSKNEIDVFSGNAPKYHKIDNFLSFSKHLIFTLLEVQENAHLHSDDWQRTVYIDTLGIKTTQFDIDDKTKNSLIESGRTYAQKYFEWFDGDLEAVNRVL